MSKIHIKNDIPFFPVALLQQLMVTHKSKTLNAVLQNMNGNCKLLLQEITKAELITTNQVPSLLILQRYVQPLHKNEVFH